MLNIQIVDGQGRLHLAFVEVVEVFRLFLFLNLFQVANMLYHELILHRESVRMDLTKFDPLRRHVVVR